MHIIIYTFLLFYFSILNSLFCFFFFWLHSTLFLVVVVVFVEHILFSSFNSFALGIDNVMLIIAFCIYLFKIRTNLSKHSTHAHTTQNDFFHRCQFPPFAFFWLTLFFSLLRSIFLFRINNNNVRRKNTAKILIKLKM